MVALSNGLEAAEFEPDPAGQPDPQNPSGGPGLWTGHDPGVRLLMPEKDHTLSNLAPPLQSLFDTLGNPVANSSGMTGKASACGMDDRVTGSAGDAAGPVPSLATGANGALWILTRGFDSARGSGAAFRGGRQLIELAPKKGDPCPTPSLTFTVSANGSSPQPASLSNPLTVPVGGTVSFDASAIDYGGGATVAYDWDFGNGDTTTVFGDPNPPYPWPPATTTEQYTQAGEYTVTMKLFGDFGEYDESGTIKVVPSTTPTASFTSSPTAPQSDAAISFDASASTPSPGASLIDYSWDWGDGTIDETASPSDLHAYLFPGRYTVKLTVRDSRDGVSAPSTEDLTVTAPPPATTTTTPVQPSPTVGPPRVSVRLGSRFLVRGRLPLTLACSAVQTSCAGTLTVRTGGGRTVGETRFSLRGGRRATVGIKLSAKVLARLKRSGSLKLTVAISAVNPQGEAGSSLHTVTVRAPRRRRRTR